MIGSFLKARKEDVRIPLHINGEEIGEAIRFAVKEIDGVEYIGQLHSLSMGLIGFNQDISNYENTAPSSGFFQDVNIRKGFCYAFDYDSYIDDILDGWGKQPTGPIPDGLLGYTQMVRNTVIILVWLSLILRQLEFGMMVLL